VLVNSAGMGLAGRSSSIPKIRLIGWWTEYCARSRRSRDIFAGCARAAAAEFQSRLLGGYAPGPYQAAYYASKAYVISLSEAL
jgi:hypothetical protein